MGGLQAAKLMCGKADPVKSQLLVVFAIFKYNCSNFMHKYILNSKTCSNPYLSQIGLMAILFQE